MIKVVKLFALLFLIAFQVAAQTAKNIKINVRKTPLSQVLLDLKENYGLQFAFDNDLLSQYKISLNRTFQSETEALSFLVKKLPLEVEKSGDVFLIIPKTIKIADQYSPVQISGQVLAARTREPLPYSYILINRKTIQSDLQGNFNYLASADTSFNLQISHLGYFVYDTIVSQSLSRQFLLMPQIERIKEVQVLANPVAKSTLIGDRAGRMKINHQIAPVLPGHGDNSVFNLLRLMPGILASGEQSNDLLIWGAYESHSKIQFDGFTVFGLKNFNDNISVVNPFVVKNIEVMKGGYEARYGGRVGGIVDIIGKDGSMQKPSFIFEANSTTLNSLLEIPLSQKSSLLAAYRQTYYQLYDPTTTTLFVKGNGENSQGNNQRQGVEFDVIPGFKFRDGNLKYTFKGKNGNRLALSLYAGGDNFLYDMEGVYLKNTITRSEEEKNNQFGASAQFHHFWKNRSSINITASYSLFKREAYEINANSNSRTGKYKVSKEIDSENEADEISVMAENSFNLKNGHNLRVGTGIINNTISLVRETKDGLVLDLNNRSPRFISYVQDELPIGKVLDLKMGIRTIYASELKKWFVEPRISASLNVTDEIKFNASWGLYNQFMSKTSVVDSAGSFTYFWTNSDNENIQVLSAEHFVSGVSFNKNGFTFSTEGFYKTTDGLSRFHRGNNRITTGFYDGNSKSYGLDFYLKKEYKRHMVWLSYTLSKTEEQFSFFSNNTYLPASHNQTHELKTAAIINLKSFYISTNYVYGSGFERFNVELDDGTNLGKSYKRLDAALVYRFKPGKVNAELGLSFLNVLNADNIKYSNIRGTTVDDISLIGVYADAIPFTPAVFIKAKF